MKLLVLAGLISVALCEHTHSSTTILLEHLLRDYDNLSPPLEQIEWELGHTILDMTLCPHKQVLKTIGWMKMMWKDERLQWSPEEWNGVTQFNIDHTKLWIPDFQPYNGADGMEFHAPPYLSKAVVTSGGNVIFVPAFTMKTFCEVNYDGWPLNQQNCTVKIGSWTYDKSVLNIKPMESFGPAIDVEHLATNKIEVVSTKATEVEKEYDCCPGKVYKNLNLNVVFNQKKMFMHNKLVTDMAGMEH